MRVNVKPICINLRSSILVARVVGRLPSLAIVGAPACTSLPVASAKLYLLPGTPITSLTFVVAALLSRVAAIVKR